MLAEDLAYLFNRHVISQHEILKKIISDSVEEWDVWPQGPRLQGEDGGKAGGAREQ
jgi:hypothetical protein